MDKTNKANPAASLKIFFISLSVFILFTAMYFVGNALADAGHIIDLNIPLPWWSTIAVMWFSPLFLSIFFLGRYFKDSGKSEKAHSVLNTISVVAMTLLLFQMLLFLTGIVG